MPGYRAASPKASREGGDGTTSLRGADDPDFPSAALHRGGHHTDDESFPSCAFDRRARAGFQDYTGNTIWSPTPSSQEEAGGGDDEKYRWQRHQPGAWALPGSGGGGIDGTRAMANLEAAPVTAAELAFCRARSSGGSCGLSPAVTAAVAAVSASMIPRGRTLTSAGPIFEATASGESVQQGAAASGIGQEERHAIFEQRGKRQPITAAEFHSRAPAIFPPPIPEPLSSASSPYAAPVAAPTIADDFADSGHSSSPELLPPPSALSAYPHGRPNLAWPHGAAHGGAGSVSRGHFAYVACPSTAGSAAVRGVGSTALPEAPHMGLMGLGLDSDGSTSPGFGVVGHAGGGAGGVWRGQEGLSVDSTP